MAQLKVNKVVFVKHHAWYLSIVPMDGIPACFWSFHDRTGMTDGQAKTKFEREHFKEVVDLIKVQLLKTMPVQDSIILN